MKFSDMYHSDRIYAADFKGREVTLTFKKIVMEVLGKGSPSEEELPVWYFDETEKRMPANKTNGVCARALFGDESDDWIGHRITLFPTKDTSGLSDDGLCIRVKGSPELERPLKFKAHVGRDTKTFTLTPTGGKEKPAAKVDGAEEAAETDEEFAKLDEQLDNPMNEKAADKVAAKEDDLL